METIIKVHALMRSGHHAVMDGIYDSLPDKKIFINNCQKSSFHWFRDGYDSEVKNNKLLDITNKNVLLNFEQKNIALDKKWLLSYKGLKETNNVIILRDPYNWLASSISKSTSFKVPINVDTKLWKQQAREFITNNNILPNFIGITYNDWVINEKYREEKLNELGLEYDKSYEMNTFKGASSFNGAKDYFNRYKNFENNKQYHNFLDDEIHELSKEIFNFNPFNK